MAIALVWIVAQRIHGVNVINAFFYPGTIGVLSMIVAYVVTNAGAFKLFVLDRGERRWELIVPPLAILFLVYVFWRNASGVPWPYDRFPWLVGVWAAIGLAIVVAVPGLANRIGTSMSRLEGGSTAGD
jgi:hypothetical protein